MILHRTAQTVSVSNAGDDKPSSNPVPVPSSSTLACTTEIIPRTRRNYISTFDPNRLKASCYVNISNTINTDIFTTSSYNPLVVKRTGQMQYTSAPNDYTRNPGSLPFPDNARGFFYFNPMSHLSPQAGELRLRCTSSQDPSSFATGFDLMDHTTGLPWSIPLLIMAKASDKYFGIMSRLIEDGLVTNSLFEDCRALTKNASISGRSTLVHSLDQLFPVSFNKGIIGIWAVGNGKMGYTRFVYPFVDLRKGYARPAVYSGKYLG